MAIKIGGVEPTNITFNGQQANYATLNGTVVWQRVSAVAFTVADTGASFSVSTTTVSWTPPSVGTLVGSPTYSNGQNLGTVSSNTNRTQTFTVTVPNDPQWTNANQNVTFSLSDIQEATVFYPPIISGLVLTQDSNTSTVANVSWSVNLQGYSQVGQTRVYYNGTQTTTAGTSISLTGMTPGTTETVTIEVDTNQGTGSATTSTFFLQEFFFTDGYVANSFAINNSGIPSATLQNGATNLTFSSPATYGLSCTAIPRGGNISFTVPSGYWNSNDTVGGTDTTTQPGYGNPAIAANMVVASGSLTNISSSGASGTHTVTVTNPTSVGEWNIVYSGTGITPSVRSGCGDRASLSWSIAANTGAARSGTITLYAGSSQTTVLDTLSWNQAAGITYHTHTYTKASNQSSACNELGTLVDVYTSTSSDPINNGNDIYSNTSLTTFAGAGWYSDGASVGYWSGTGWSNTGLCAFGGGGL
jgi:hypothetical protein